MQQARCTDSWPLSWSLDRAQQSVHANQAEHMLLMHAEVMQPDEATLSKILSDSSLLEGFQDTAVMEAVAEIAQDPNAFKKHTANAKASSTISSTSHTLTACTFVVSHYAVMPQKRS